MSRCTSRYAACLLGLQATHTVIQSANPVKVPLQALTRQGVVLLALRTSCPQPDSLLVKLPRQIPHAISQKVQVPAYIPPGGPPHLGRKREALPCPTAGHPAVADRTPHQREGSPGQDGSQSGDAR
ncbi:hypothetical protein PR001_g31601 [Phytophthora rubi]|uniref:Uncharacterized protein n=1 Tax=Phytophthora rubi TaxID=129364 RepID=A0A6A3GHJ3_9STRA|nr:hypothetical protein PR001_g31601 [Phytophthora rubi]